MPNQYFVTYEIETSASTPLEAARIAEEYMRNPVYRPVLRVFNQATKEETFIDLEEDTQLCQKLNSK